MPKPQPGPYDQYDDLQLLLRYNKLEEDYNKFFEIPIRALPLGHPARPTGEKSQAAAEKIDKICMEMYRRGLTGPNGQESPLSLADREKNIKLGQSALKLPMGQGPKFEEYAGGESPFCTSLTPKALALRPWADSSIVGKWSIFFHFAKKEEIAVATAPVEEKYEAIRKASCDEDNAEYERLKCSSLPSSSETSNSSDSDSAKGTSSV